MAAFDRRIARSVFITPSGRRWTATPCRLHGQQCVLMTPQGAYGFGGVKAKHVDRERIDQGDKVWKPA